MGQIGLRRRAVGNSFQRVVLPVHGEFRGVSQVNAVRHGAAAPFAHVGADHAALKLGEPAKHGQDQSARGLSWCRRMCHAANESPRPSA